MPLNTEESTTSAKVTATRKKSLADIEEKLAHKAATDFKLFSDSNESVKISSVSSTTETLSADVTVSIGSNNNLCEKESMFAEKMTKLERKSQVLKDECKEDIKNYAEDTMKELLGWYGYGQEAFSRAAAADHQQRKIKPGAVVNQPDLRASPSSDSESSGSKHHVIGQDRGADEEDGCEEEPRGSSRNDRELAAATSPISENGREVGAFTQEQFTSSVLSDEDSMAATELKATEPTFVVCSWCQKGKSLEKQYVLLTSEGRRKFCSQQCFDQCRREKYRKHKICDWCKENCGSSNVVEFEDGEGLYLFCSDECLNKYKMNIFCQETQEHIKALQAEGALKSAASTNTSSNNSQQIIITPELWTDENKLSQPMKKEKIPSSGNKFIDDACSVGKISQENLMLSQSPAHMSLFSNHQPKASRTRATVQSIRMKSEQETSRHSSIRSSNQRPPRMTDREKIKQIRMRDNLPLFTPLRETCRSNSNTSEFSIASLTSKSDSPTLISNTAKSIMHSTATPIGDLSKRTMSSSHYGTLRNVQLSPSSLRLKRDNIAIDGRTSEDSTSSSSISPRTSQSLNTPLAPVYPPPNPFSQPPLHPFFANPAAASTFPFPLPPSLSLYSSLYSPHSSTAAAAALLNPLASAAATAPPPVPNLIPPSTLMFPYPFVLPIPLPLPFPIPVSEAFMEDLKNAAKDPVKEEKDEDVKESASLKDFSTQSQTVNSSDRKSSLSQINKSLMSTNSIATRSDVLHKSSNNSQTRYFIDLERTTGNKALSIKSSSGVETENEVMDLSTTTDNTHSRRQSASPDSCSSTNNTLHSNKDHVRDSNATILVIQPEDNRLSPPTPKSPFYLPPAATSTAAMNHKYSSRRNLILDAPNVPVGSGSRSPSPEKRGYNGPSSARDFLYGKRKCVRPRVKTK